MTPAALLSAARERIGTPEKWTQHTFARNIWNREVSSIDPTACSFCVMGALVSVEVLHKAEEPVMRAARDALIFAATGKIAAGNWDRHETLGTVTSLNDKSTTTHDDILALFDRAIKHAEAL